jgi:dienelactone hydrolase
VVFYLGGTVFDAMRQSSKSILLSLINHQKYKIQLKAKMLRKLKQIALLSFFISSYVFAQDVEKSWEDAVVYIPGKFFTTSVGKVSVDKPLPVVIYLHGCFGLNRTHDASWASLLADQGFIVVMPDSMARPGRIPNCDPKIKGGNFFPNAFKYRQQEIGYALEQTQKASWADKRNIFLMGFSEGGVGVAQSTHDGFAGRIIMGWSCTNKNNPAFDGIFSSKDSPVLAIASENDDWRIGKPTAGTCANKAQDRTNFKNVDIPGSEHTTYGSDAAKDAVKSFLTQYRSK